MPRPRARRGSELEIDPAILDAVRLEGRELDRRTLGILARCGVRELTFERDDYAERPPRLLVRIPGPDGYTPIDWREPAPVTAAVERLVGILPRVDMLRRLLLAMTDFEEVADAAEALATYLDDPDFAHPIRPLAQMIEAGIVILYARNFTGAASIGDSRRPPAGPERELHDWLMDLRNQVVAHADHNETRRLIDVNAHLGIPGPPVIAEVRDPLFNSQKARSVVEVCRALSERLNEETWNLKRELGIPVGGDGRPAEPAP